jgi:hypothetical protein
MRLIIGCVIGGLAWMTSAASAAPRQADADNLKLFVGQILGPMQYTRNYKNPQELNRTAAWITEQMRLFSIPCQYQNFNLNQKQYRNVICRLNAGHPDKVVIGAHYDVEGESRGVNHNASGVAGVIEAAHLLSQSKNSLKNNVEFVFYTLATVPYLNTEHMGSIRHAKSLVNAPEPVNAIYVLDQIGFYDSDFVQEYPVGLKWLYPNHANFIAVVSNIASRDLASQYCQNMQKIDQLACERFSLPFNVFEDSDHLSYWKYDLPAVLITDTGQYRNKNQYRTEVELKRLDYKKMAAVVDGVVSSITQ